ncbi:alpha/beta-hydrolase, partial [Marasmius fiardii PR-910]
SESAYKVTDRHIDVGGGTQVLARCVVPIPEPGEDVKYPLLFWIHGGGWTIGDIHWDDYKCRKLAVEKRVSVVNVEYRLAPEHPFPAAPNDILVALKYVAQKEESFSADLSRGFLIAGMSAGGNLAAVTAHQYLDDPLSKSKPLTGQILVIPVTCHPKAYPEAYKSQLQSMERNKEAPILPRSTI